MKNSVISYRPISVVCSEHVDAEKTPAQSVYAKGYKGRAEILPEFADGLRDLEGFSHIYLVYLDGTPLIDIKPYTARFDHVNTTRNGWLDEVDDETARERGRRGYKGGGIS